MTELFANFEINRVPRWPLMSRLLAGSVVFHGLFLVAVAYVPTVQAVLGVAGSFAGVRVVSEDYDKTLIGQRATLVKLDGPYEKLYYPADYFGSPANPYAELDPAAAAVIAQAASPPPPPPAAIIRPQPRPRATPGPTPEPSPEASPSPEEIAQADTIPSGVQVSADEQAKAEAEMNRAAQENNVKRPDRVVNTKPLTDVLELAKKMKDDGRVDLNSVIEMTVEADRRDDGTLENAVITGGSASNQEIETLAKEFVSALSASRALLFLEGTKHLVMTLKVDGQVVSVDVKTEAESAERAAKMALGYGALLAGARKLNAGKDEVKIWEKMNVSADGKQVIMKFEMPRDMAGELLGKVKSEG